MAEKNNNKFYGKSFTIICDGECGSPVDAVLELHSTLYGLRCVLVCQGCGYVQTEETKAEVLSPNYKPPILHYYSGWIYSDNSDYELWKNLLSHDCKVGQGLHLVTIDNNYFFREIYHNGK